MILSVPPPNIPPMTAEQATAFLTGPGGRFELVPTNVRGEVMKYWKESAQSVREIWLEAVKEFGDRDYLVYSRQQPAEDERLTVSFIYYC